MPVPKYISAEEYARKSGLSPQKVKDMCKSGKLDYYKTEGGYYKIKEDNDSVPVDKYIKVEKENERLKTIINTILSTANQINS